MCALLWRARPAATAEHAHKRLHRPSYDDLLRQVITLTLERDEWKEAYLELRKLMNVPEC